ncbi:MAG TPA: EI24 domain-containing protein [Glaciihabitans sp.]|nr:EI24 domain-containing protein [Glaciihabitans sp.]
MTGSPIARVSIPRQFAMGVAYLIRGFGMWITSPRLMLIGAIPALIVGTFYLAGIIILIVNIDTVVLWATPFADQWAPTAALATRIAVTVAVIAVAALLAVYTFTAVTLFVGDPFYERIWRSVENQLGNAPDPIETGFWRGLGRAVGDGVRLLFPALLVGLVVLICGIVPLIGAPLALVIGALIGGWVLAVELTGFAFDARGFTLAQRRQALRRNRAVSVGFGGAAYLLFLVPVVAVIAMPAAVAGAAMLSRDALDAHKAPAQP